MVDDDGRRSTTLPIIAADKAAVRQHVQVVACTQLATTHDASEAVDVVDDIARSSTDQLTWRDDATAAGALHTVPSVTRITS